LMLREMAVQVGFGRRRCDQKRTLVRVRDRG